MNNDELEKLFDDMCCNRCHFPYVMEQEELDEKCEDCPLNKIYDEIMKEV